MLWYIYEEILLQKRCVASQRAATKKTQIFCDLFTLKGKRENKKKQTSNKKN
jgi:hypothetical protein